MLIISDNNLYFSERITKAMSEILNYPLTIIEAPMGYGKTTAVLEQLNFYNANIMLQRIYENSLNSFWRGFCNLFSCYDEGCYQSLLQLQFPNDSISLEAALNIIEEVELPRNSVIIIDDYHIVECNELNVFIEFLIMNEVMDIKIVLITRYTSFLRLEELKLKEYLYHIEKETFELMPKDIVAYYKQCKIKISLVEAEELYNFTEGWISALYLFMLNYESKDSNLHLSNIYMLIDKVVYTPLTEECKDLLINMCIFNRFTLEQAEYIWKGAHAASQLMALVEKNAFITYDYSEKTYVMHSILRKFLGETLENKENYYKDVLYKIAAKWYMEKGEYLLAMHYANLALDFDTLLKAFEFDKGFGINIEYKNSIIKYFEECPVEVKKKYPFAVIIYTRQMFKFNEMKLFKKGCDEFETNIKNMDELDEDYKNRLLGEYELLLSFAEYNDIDKMSERHRRSYQMLKSPSSILDQKVSWTFGSPSVLYMFYRKAGELEKEVQSIKKSMPFYCQVTDGHGKGADDVMEAERYYYMGDLENSEIAIHKASQVINEDSHSGINICSIFLKIKLALMKGEFQTVLDLFKVTHEDIKNKKLYLFMHTLDVCEAHIYASLNMHRNIPSWIKNGEFKNTRLYFPAMAFLNIVYGRSLLINGEYLKLIGSFEGFMGIASVFPNLLSQIYSYIYLAAANIKLLRNNEASKALLTALSIASQDRVYMPFVENCDYIKPLLEELTGHDIYFKDIERILKLCVSYQNAIEQITNKYFIEKKPKLTEREMDIAKLASEGFSNKSIGESLNISANTVKTQLKTIFEKLGVNSRVLLKKNLQIVISSKKLNS